MASTFTQGENPSQQNRGTPSSESARDRFKLVVAFAAVYIVWGSTYLAIRFAIETLPPFLMAGMRMFLAGGVLYAWAKLRGAPTPGARHWREAWIIGAFLLLGGNGCVVWAAHRVPSGVLALLVGATPFFMVLIGWLWAGDGRPGLQTVAGLVTGFGGLALLIGPGKLAGAGGVDTLGALVAIGATLSWAIGSNYARFAPLPKSKMMVTAMEMLTGGVLLTALGLIVGETRHVDFANMSAKSLAAFAYLLVFGSIVGFSAYIYLLSMTKPALASSYAFVNPVVAVFLGWALANEPLNARTLVAAAIIILAVVAITFDRARKQVNPPDTESEVA